MSPVSGKSQSNPSRSTGEEKTPRKDELFPRSASRHVSSSLVNIAATAPPFLSPDSGNAFSFYSSNRTQSSSAEGTTEEDKNPTRELTSEVICRCPGSLAPPARC